MSELDVFVTQFLAESRENLAKSKRILAELEVTPTAPDKLEDLFRAIHSIRGTASFFGYSRLEELTHAGEDVLKGLRNGTLLLTSEITCGILALVNVAYQILSNIEITGGEGEQDDRSVVEQLRSFCQVNAQDNRKLG